MFVSVLFRKALGVTSESAFKMADDDELDELLDSALNDFDKPATPSAKKVNQQSANPDDNKAIDVSSTTDSGEVNQPSEDELSKIFAESFAEAAVDLEEAMKKMGGGQDADFMAHLSHLANSAKQAASKESPEAMNAFEDNLAKTMNEMAQNAKDLENPDAFGDDLVKAMSSMGLDGGDGMDMMPLMQGMMKNLLAKDILYPSLKELHDKYPAWLEEHKSSNSDEQHARFTKQHELVGQLCHEYEKENPDDSDEVLKARFETIMDLMQKMQECGQPPEELVGKMGAGAPFGPGCMPGIPDMSPDLPNECNPS